MRPGAPAFPRLQAGLQDADLAGLRARRQASSTPTCSSASPATSSAITCATTSRARRHRRRHRALVHARPHLRHGSRRRAPAASADQRQGAGRAAANSAFGAGVKTLPARPALLPADLDSTLSISRVLPIFAATSRRIGPSLLRVDWRERLGVARLEVVEDEARAHDDAATFRVEPNRSVHRRAIFSAQSASTR